jgi:hypothetical protein
VIAPIRPRRIAGGGNDFGPQQGRRCAVESEAVNYKGLGSA